MEDASLDSQTERDLEQFADFVKSEPSSNIIKMLTKVPERKKLLEKIEQLRDDPTDEELPNAGLIVVSRSATFYVNADAWGLASLDPSQPNINETTIKAKNATRG